MKNLTCDALVQIRIITERLTRSVRYDTLDEVFDAILEKIEMYHRILENGQNILETAYGESHSRLSRQRCRCWDFLHGMNQTLTIITNLRRTK